MFSDTPLSGAPVTGGFHSTDADFRLMALEPRVLLSAASGASLPVFDSLLAPSDLAATAMSSEHLRLTWTDNSTSETGFGIQWFFGGMWRTLATVEADVTEFDHFGLMPASTYAYRVWAFNDTNASAFSNVAVGTTVPLAPAYLTATTLSESEVELNWDWVMGANGYQIERSVDGVDWVLAGTVEWDMLSFTDSVLAAGTTYHYRVMAVNAGGQSEPSETASATTEGGVDEPGDPVDDSVHLVLTPVGRHMRLTWSTNADEVLGFTIERSTDDGATWTAVAAVDVDVTTYMDKHLDRSATYSYRVQLITSDGSVDSGEVTTAAKHHGGATVLFTTAGPATASAFSAQGAARGNAAVVPPPFAAIGRPGLFAIRPVAPLLKDLLAPPGQLLLEETGKTSNSIFAKA